MSPSNALSPARGQPELASAVALQADVSNAAQVADALETLTRALGPVDVLVNAHGIYPNVPLLEMAVDEWDESLRPFGYIGIALGLQSGD